MALRTCVKHNTFFLVTYINRNAGLYFRLIVDVFRAFKMTNLFSHVIFPSISICFKILPSNFSFAFDH